MAQPFNHGFKFLGDNTDSRGIFGFTTCLNQLLIHLQEVTEYKPEKRYIDSVQLLERITATLDELKPIQSQFAEHLKSHQTT